MASVGFVRPANRMNSESTYTFSSLPRALVQPRNKMRDYSKGEDIIRNQRIGSRSVTMSRKNGYGHQGKNEQLIPWTMTVRMIPDMAVSQELFRLKAPLSLTTGNGYKSRTKGNNNQIGTLTIENHVNAYKNELPPPTGRKHLETQTELHLEELTNCIKEADAGCQTDAYYEEPPSLATVPINFASVKPSIDAATQIDEEELFDFDMESQPVLETLINHAVRWAVVELLQEEDIADIKRQRRRFQQLRKAYLSGENLNEKKESKEVSNEDASNFKHSIHTWSYNTQTETIQNDLERAFLPWILEEVEGELNSDLKR